MAGGAISIHTALAGCDAYGSTSAGLVIYISIHTALAGCDDEHGVPFSDADHFNPHSPRRL